MTLASKRSKIPLFVAPIWFKEARMIIGAYLVISGAILVFLGMIICAVAGFRIAQREFTIGMVLLAVGGFVALIGIQLNGMWELKQLLPGLY